MPKNSVICRDDTDNEIEGDLSNVLIVPRDRDNESTMILVSGRLVNEPSRAN